MFINLQAKESDGSRPYASPSSPIFDAPSPKKVLRVSVPDDVVHSSQQPPKSHRPKNRVIARSLVEKAQSAAFEKRDHQRDQTSSSRSLNFGDDNGSKPNQRPRIRTTSSENCHEDESDGDLREPLPGHDADSEVEVTSTADSGEEDKAERPWGILKDVGHKRKESDEQAEASPKANSPKLQAAATTSERPEGIRATDRGNRAASESSIDEKSCDEDIDKFNAGMIAEESNWVGERPAASSRTCDESFEGTVLGSSARNSGRPPSSAVLPTRTFVKVDKEIKAITNTLESVDKRSIKVCTFLGHALGK